MHTHSHSLTHSTRSDQFTSAVKNEFLAHPRNNALLDVLVCNLVVREGAEV
jgi:hypothetical protein